MSKFILIHHSCAFAFAASFSLSAATISGTVYDQSNTPRSGVEVKLDNNGAADTTDDFGVWTLSTGPATVYLPQKYTGVTEVMYTGNSVHLHLVSPEAVQIRVTDMKGVVTGPPFYEKLDAGTHRIPLNRRTATVITFLHIRIREVGMTVPVCNGLPFRFAVPGTDGYTRKSSTVASRNDMTTLSYSWKGTVMTTDRISTDKDTSGMVRFLTIPPYEGIPWNDSIHYGILIDDRDNAVYRTITIGSQTWMAQNLNYGNRINGEDNQNGSADEKYCYKDLPARCDTFGGLYQWHTVMALTAEFNGKSASDQIEKNHQGICPQGWHVPTTGEWSELKNYTEEYAGNDSMSAQTLKSTDNWATEMGWGPGTDDLGFRAIACGGRYYEGYNSKSTGSESFFRWCCRFRGMFWTASEVDDSTAYYEDISDDKTSLTRMSSPKRYGFCIRCTKD